MSGWKPSQAPKTFQTFLMLHLFLFPTFLTFAPLLFSRHPLTSVTYCFPASHPNCPLHLCLYASGVGLTTTCRGVRLAAPWTLCSNVFGFPDHTTLSIASYTISIPITHVKAQLDRMETLPTTFSAEAYFETQPPPLTIEQDVQSVREFLKRQRGHGTKVVLVTVRGIVPPLHCTGHIESSSMNCRAEGQLFLWNSMCKRNLLVIVRDDHLDLHPNGASLAWSSACSVSGSSIILVPVSKFYLTRHLLSYPHHGCWVHPVQRDL